MADVNSIQKLLNLKWVTTDQTPSTNYFTINAQTHTKTVQNKRQLFFVKIEDCVMENGPEYQSLD
jgi:PKD repeat protein